jgi:hypothetical protein
MKYESLLDLRETYVKASALTEQRNMRVAGSLSEMLYKKLSLARRVALVAYTLLVFSRCPLWLPD